MSYFEYDDLYLKAQKRNAKFIAFVFDIKNSKSMDKNTRYIAQIKTIETIDLMIKKTNELENNTNKKILINESPVQKLDNIINMKDKTYMYLNNPCILFGDSFCFYCYNNSISVNDFKILFKKCCEKCKNNTKYHFNYGKFETLKYEEANEKYYIGYIVEKLSKEKIEENIL